MKSLNEVNKEIKDLLNIIGLVLDDREANKRRKRLQYLNIMKNYLETKPTREFLLKEKKRLQKRLEIINEGFTDWSKFNSCENPLVEYKKLMGVKTIKEHLKSISFILN